MPNATLIAVFHLAIAVAYLLLARQVWASFANDGDAASARTAKAPPVERIGLPLIALGHGVLVTRGMFADGDFTFGFALALSATLWMAVVITWLEGLYVPLRGLLPLILPAAALAVLLPLVFPGGTIGAERNAAFKLHLHAAIFAYGLFTIAAAHALLMAALERRLHRGRGALQSGPGRLLRHTPPLLAMERLLFRLIGIGFLLLTVTVASGLFFSEQVFGQALRWEHKTVFAIASWLIFGALLAGRAVLGWRGRVALRWTLAGFVMLLLAYVGTSFVLEVVLHRR